MTHPSQLTNGDRRARFPALQQVRDPAAMPHDPITADRAPESWPTLTNQCRSEWTDVP